MAATPLLVLPDLVPALRLAIRLTARSSWLLFLLVFTASAAARHWPGALTRWQLRNRRHLGLAFAVSHTVHLAAILGFANLDPAGFHQASSLGNQITGGIAYGFIALMALSSSDTVAAWLGRKTWGRLHTAGIYYLWISFMVTFGKRIPTSASYAVPVVILLLALAFRLWPQRKTRLTS
ncbi:hypothetical protein LRH25_09925 [Ideonella azotifigens]|uniref:Ferric oxidoreductase domain-containing protein n=1 Tax=Ideonella azotifigens TaxID=513160 RepID=A0ABN1KET5_9BURK|nr:hypothetical protein [Ideonella azotifigens]MCD2340661.1 hypothetical protein [Ideonella azotifigens]